MTTLPQAILNVPPNSSMRIGTIIGISGGGVVVRISGSDTEAQAGRTRNYEPIVGEMVALIRQGSTWLALGGIATMPEDNKVVNGGFEADGAISATTPSSWTYNHTGTLTTTVGTATSALGAPPPDGSYVLDLTVDLTGTTTLTAVDTFSSEPFPIGAGQVWAISAMQVMTLSAQTLDGLRVQGAVSLYGFADETTVFPSGTLLASTSSGQCPYTRPWMHRQIFTRDDNGVYRGFSVPDGYDYGRIVIQNTVVYNGLYAVSAGGIHCYWDRVVARQL